ncbi:hypothetical protein GFM44_39370 [Rhizobium leguminosarum bv. viciae]|nr:hypothetical protein [Rhizobium leguminosarum bv. viciae]
MSNRPSELSNFYPDKFAQHARSLEASLVGCSIAAEQTGGTIHSYAGETDMSPALFEYRIGLLERLQSVDHQWRQAGAEMTDLSGSIAGLTHEAGSYTAMPQGLPVGTRRYVHFGRECDIEGSADVYVEGFYYGTVHRPTGAAIAFAFVGGGDPKLHSTLADRLASLTRTAIGIVSPDAETINDIKFFAADPEILKSASLSRACDFACGALRLIDQRFQVIQKYRPSFGIIH